MADLGLRKLFINIGGTMLRQIVAALMGIGLAVLLARTLGPQGNGTYAMTILLPTLLANLLNLGIPSANTYYIGRGNISVQSAFDTNIRLWFILSVLGALLALLVIKVSGESLFPGVPKVFLWAALILFPLELVQFFLKSLLQGAQDFRRFNLVSLVTPAGTLIFAVVAVQVFHLGVPGALLSFGLGYLLGLLFTLGAVRTHFYVTDQTKQDANYVKQCLGYGWKAHLSNILTFINYRADLYLVNLLLNPIDTGIYVIAIQLAERLWMLSQAVSTVILPRLSELDHDEDSRKRLTPIVARWVFLVTIIAAGIVALLITPLIEILFGSQYLPAAGAFIWLLPGIVLFSFSRVLANDLAARGRPELNMYTALLIVIVNVLANMLLIPKIGIKGAALATTIAYSCNAVVNLFLFVRISGNKWWEAVFFNRSDLKLLQSGMHLLSNFGNHKQDIRKINNKATYRLLKRFIDLVLALLLIVFLFPVMLLISLAIKIESGSPVIFIQKRAGLNGKPFRIFKFRTMLSGPLNGDQKIKDEEKRITRLGRLLRSTSLDELPQLFNVVKGEMSLVGPRPTLLYQVERYNNRQKKRLEVRPGMTGWAQVNKGEHFSWEKRIEMDLWYLEHQSLALDLKILWQTAGVIFKKRVAWVEQSQDPLAGNAGVHDHEPGEDQR
ncbi:MAG: sugar transferase [Desulfotomaculaceae bacterium]|nr:sugar transferase [Desulfotomaculaceae bacterium]